MDISQYRGKKGLLKTEHFVEGGKALHENCGGSTSLAVDFLGYVKGGGGPKLTIRTWWETLGLEANHVKSPIAYDVSLAEKLSYHTDSEEPSDSGLRSSLPRDGDPEAIREYYLKFTAGGDIAPLYEWEVSPGTEYAHLVFLGDLHYGSPEMDYARLLRLLDWIKEHPDVRWIGMGDYLNLVTMQSPGIHRDALGYDDANALMEADFEPIMPQCAIIHRGNHDERIMRGLQIKHDQVKRWADDYDVLYGGYLGYIRIHLTDGNNKQDYTGFQHHGFGSGATWGYVINCMERLANHTDSDWVAMGHRHQRAAIESTKTKVSTRPGSDAVDFTSVWLLATGSFEKWTKDGYAAKKGMRPSSLGAATAHLYLDRHSVHGRA